jgi:hypothetical protein
MPQFDTVTELLVSQTERKLQKLRDSIVAEIQRLGLELKLVDEALNRKRSRARDAVPVARTPQVKSGKGHAHDGLPRSELLVYVTEMKRPVKPSQVRDHLATKGIVRRVEAVRNGLIRLERDGTLTRLPDGRFAVPSKNGDGLEVKTDSPGAGSLSLDGQDAT